MTQFDPFIGIEIYQKYGYVWEKGSDKLLYKGTIEELKAVIDEYNGKPKPSEIDKKFEARILLCDNQPRIIQPSDDEWVGVNLLERDDQLERKRHVPIQRPDDHVPVRRRNEGETKRTS